MIDDHDLFERAVERFAPPEGSFERLATRRDRKHRNKRITAGVLALVVAAAGTAALVRAFPSGRVPADDPASGFMGRWTAPDLQDESTQSLTIRASAEADDQLEIALRDYISSACENTPARMTGTGRLQDPNTLVIPALEATCVDGRVPTFEGSAQLEEYTLVLDPTSDRLFDSFELVWQRAPAERSVEPGADSSEETSPGSYSFLGGDVTFRDTPPWTDHAEAYIDPRLFFLIGPDDAWIEILANPVIQQGTRCPEDPSLPASAEELVRDIRSNPDLEATEPVLERIGGIDAVRLDVRAVPGAAGCEADRVPVVSVSGRSGAWGGVEPDGRGRLYVLDMPGGSARALAIWITATEAAFDRTVESAAPVLDSFEFRTG